jgi:hypothetical protein
LRVLLLGKQRPEIASRKLLNMNGNSGCFAYPPRVAIAPAGFPGPLRGIL